jgi:metallo-beta-lactamase class B
MQRTKPEPARRRRAPAAPGRRSGAKLLAILASVLASAAVIAQDTTPALEAMNQPVVPYRIIGNIYYVGANDIACYLIATSGGLILLDGGLVTTAPQIRSNVARLGFALGDVRILLNSHAHTDHAGGLAQLKAWTGAQLVASEPEAPLLAAGGAGPLAYGDTGAFPPIRADRQIPDGGQVTLGETTLTAHLTPGHTRGCTTWTMKVADQGKLYDVVFVGSASVLQAYRLVDRPSYPGIAADFAHTFAVMAALPCDVFLGSHAQFFDGLAKAARLRAGATPNPFIDPAGYRAWVASGEAGFRQRLAAEEAAAATPTGKPR